MKKNNNYIIIVLAILIIILLILGINMLNNKKNKETIDNKIDTEQTEKTEEIKYNSNEQVIENKEVDGITFTNIDCYWDGENTIITYTIKNTTTEQVKIGKYKIEAYNEENKLIYTLNPYLEKELSPNEEYEESIATADNLSNAYSIKIFLNK